MHRHQRLIWGVMLRLSVNCRKPSTLQSQSSWYKNHVLLSLESYNPYVEAIYITFENLTAAKCRSGIPGEDLRAAGIERNTCEREERESF